MLSYRTLYLPWFVFYIEWKSVLLELLTSIVPNDYGELFLFPQEFDFCSYDGCSMNVESI